MSAAFFLPVTAWASPGTAGDKTLATAIADQVRNYSRYTIFDDVQGMVSDGVVTLTGSVTDPFKAKEIADRVARVQGVREVDNKIQPLPTSIFDDELRATIASSIYRDPMLWNYGIQTNPPIHIVVNNGHVTLTGVVNSEVERRVAELAARDTFGAFGVDKKLRVDNEMGATD